MSERYRQRVLPDDAFAPEAVSQFKREFPETDSLLLETLDESADILANGRYCRQQRDNVREFMARTTGFQKQEAHDVRRKMLRAERTGKRTRQ